MRLPLYFVTFLAICGVFRHFNGGVKPYILKYYGNTAAGVVTSKVHHHGKGGNYSFVLCGFGR